MQRFFIISLVVSFIALVACSKVPGDIIKPKTMENLLVDIHKAEAYMENSKYLANNKLAQDSIKNSIYAKHGVTGAEFDTSIVWYISNFL